MKIDDELIQKFPALLRDKLSNNEIEFPDTTMFEYDNILTYRAIARKKDDYHAVTSDDFKSYYELGQFPKKQPRGLSDDPSKDPRYYGVSSFLKKEIVEQKMRFPNPNKKMAVGYVHSTGGPQLTEDQHVCWWLYEGADVRNFKIIEERTNE